MALFKKNKKASQQETTANKKGASAVIEKIKPLLKPKVILILLAVLAVIIAVIFGIVQINRWRNDGARYASSLSEQIGTGIQDAQKQAHLTLTNTSDFACINMAAEGQFLYESKNTVQVSGVTIPEWVIMAKNNNNVLTEVTYYDYSQLKKYGNGVKTSARIAAEGITNGMDSKAVQDYIGFEPLSVVYTSTTSYTEHYKYYFKDKNTGDTVSYILSVTYLEDAVISKAEQENYFILSVLTLN